MMMGVIVTNEKRFRAPNINNYVVNTNFNAIKGANGRRYFVVNLNTSKQNNHTYFKHIMNQCFNDEIGHAFFCYLYDIDTSAFNALDMPETQNKSDLCIELMQPHESFLKDVYILNQRGLGNSRVSDVYNKYVDYCTSKKQNQISPQRFCQEMRNLNIPYKKISVNKFENITYEFLYNLASKKKWLHDLDNDFKVAEDDEVEVLNNLDGKPTVHVNNDEMKNIMDKNLALEKRIQELELKHLDDIAKLENENKRLKEQLLKFGEEEQKLLKIKEEQQQHQYDQIKKQYDQEYEQREQDMKMDKKMMESLNNTRMEELRTLSVEEDRLTAILKSYKKSSLNSDEHEEIDLIKSELVRLEELRQTIDKHHHTLYQEEDDKWQNIWVTHDRSLNMLRDELNKIRPPQYPNQKAKPIKIEEKKQPPTTVKELVLDFDGDDDDVFSDSDDEYCDGETDILTF